MDLFVVPTHSDQSYDYSWCATLLANHIRGQGTVTWRRGAVGNIRGL